MDMTIVLVIILGFSLMILPGYFNIILCKKYYFFKNIAQKKYIYVIWVIYSFLVCIKNVYKYLYSKVAFWKVLYWKVGKPNGAISATSGW